MKVLHIEDDEALSDIVALILSAEGAVVETTDLGEEGVDLAKIYDFDAIMIDGTLPDMTGLEIVRQLRESAVGTPIMMLTGDATTQQRVACLNAGADDYLTKPFHNDELIARLKALVRRSRGLVDSMIHVGPISLNMNSKTVKVGQQAVHLTGQEYRMMELLAMRKGSTLTKEAFMDHLYGGRDEPEMKIVDVFMCKLRRKLNNASPGAGDLIETVWGRGYVLREPEAAVA